MSTAVIALSRYQVSLLLRSHRWIPAAVIYSIGVIGLGGVGGGAVAHGSALTEGLSWSALMLVPCVAWLTRSVLTAEPAAARSCVAAAGGPRQAQLAALAAAFGLTAAFGVVGIIWELITCGVIRSHLTNSVLIGATLGDVARGTGTALVCLLVGSAIGALCNPPLITRPAASMLLSTTAVVVGLTSGVSPANAAVRSGYGQTSSSWSAGLQVIAALALLVVAWSISALVAARRSG
ncbi:MAG TPA: hypothetical protein VFQ44_03125 [Streptosporangiaceae bacterium]|nr:hypothetical protein [Streptosporangiaceae bacterium]